MIMYNYIYSSIFYLCLSLFPIFCWYFQSKIKFSKLIYFFFFIIITFLIGFRYKVGPDAVVLVYIYEILEKNEIVPITLEFGFVMLMSLFKHLDLAWWNLQAFLTFVGMLFYFKLSLKYKDYWYLVALATPIFFLLIGINSTRQFVALSVFTYFVMMNSNAFNFKSFFLVFLGALLHKSFFLLAFPLFLFLAILKYFQFIRNYIFYLSIIIFFLIFISFDILTKYYLMLTGYANSVYLVLDLYNDGYYIRSIFISVFFIISFIVFKFNSNIYVRGIIFYFIVFFIGTLILSLINTTLADRFNFYLYAFMFFITIKFIELPNNYIKTKYLKLFFILYNFIYMFIWLNFAYIAYTWFPYKNYYFN